MSSELASRASRVDKSAASVRTPAPRAETTSDEVGPKPFLKWAGGKWSLAPAIARLLPTDLAKRTYREPFLGGGALFFWLARRKMAGAYVLSDALNDLVVAYNVVREQPQKLVKRLEELRKEHTADAERTFYEVRDRYNDGTGSPLERAAYLIYLNKTCYNGLYRTNRSGHFNVPIGRFAKPNIADKERLLAASGALGQAESITHRDFESLLQDAKEGDVVYLDPPYVPVSRTSNFEAYAGGAFGEKSQARLAEVFRELDDRGCRLILSNSDTEEVKQLYAGFDLKVLDAARQISSRTSTRGRITELLVRNTRTWKKAARPLE